ncbi:MAG: ABC transporter permease [Methanomassiliicoccales archaeon]
MYSTKMASPNEPWLRSSFTRLAENARHYIISTSLVFLFLIAWQIAPTVGWVNPIYVPTPTAILNEMIKMTLSGVLVDDIIISMTRIFFGLGLALAVALPMGFLLGGWFSSIETSIDPLILVLSQANPFTLLPVFMTLLGVGELSKIAVIFWVCQFPILFGTVAGIKNVDPALVKMGRSVGLNKVQIFSKVQLPNALPSIFTGFRLSALFAFFMLIGAEMLGANSGLGYLIITSCPFHTASFQLERMWAGIVTVAILGVLLNWSISLIEKRFTSWKEDINL